MGWKTLLFFWILLYEPYADGKAKEYNNNVSDMVGVNNTNDCVVSSVLKYINRYVISWQQQRLCWSTKSIPDYYRRLWGFIPHDGAIDCLYYYEALFVITSLYYVLLLLLMQNGGSYHSLLFE